MRAFIKTAFLAFAIAMLSGIIPAQIATGGPYSLRQGVLGGGGDKSTAAGNVYAVTGTTGQPATGHGFGAPYLARGGFWSPLLPATASGVTISGRVLTAEGRGIRGAVVSLMGNGLSTPRNVLTGINGTFTFGDVEPGQTYIVSVRSRRFGFGESSQVISVTDSIADIVFQSSWQN